MSWFTIMSPVVTIAQYQSQMSLTQLAGRARVVLSQGATAVNHGYSFVLWTYWRGGAADCNAGWGVGDVGSWEAPVPLQ